MNVNVLYRCEFAHAVSIADIKVTKDDGREYVIRRGTALAVRPPVAHRAALLGLVRSVEDSDMNAPVWPASAEAKGQFIKYKSGRFDLSYEPGQLVAKIEKYNYPAGPPIVIKAFERAGLPAPEPKTGFESRTGG